MAGFELLLLASALAIQDARRIELPPGPVADALMKVSPDAVPAPTPQAWVFGARELDWKDPATWKSWAKFLSDEAAASSPDGRAFLARLALAQGRLGDAWNHFSACSISPDLVNELMPEFLPGVRVLPSEVRGGIPAVLAEDVELRPSLPPPTPGAMRGRVDRRSMSIRGLVVGAATIAMKVAVEPEGVQIELEHLAGSEAWVRVRIPEDPEFAFSVEYVDWMKQDQRGVAHRVDLKPGDEAHTLYARFEPRPLAWPTSLPDKLPAQILSGTLWLEIEPKDPDRALVLAVADSLAKGPLALRTLVRAPHSKADGWTGVAIDLTNAEERGRKLAWLASAVERKALAR